MRSFALLLLVACESDSDTDPNGAVTEPEGWPASVRIGTGDRDFVPLTDGAPLLLFRAEQASARPYHVNVGGEVTGLSTEVGVVASLRLLDSGEPLGDSAQASYIGLAAFDEASCSGLFYGVRLQADAFVPPEGQDDLAFVCSLDGAPVELAVEVEDLRTGEVAGDSVAVVLTLDATTRSYCP